MTSQSLTQTSIEVAKLITVTFNPLSEINLMNMNMSMMVEIDAL